MRAILFRKLVVEGVNYYQLYDEVNDFEKTPEFNEFADYDHRDEKDFFYIDGDNNKVDIDEPSYFNIFVDSISKDKNIGSKLVTLKRTKKNRKIFTAFKEKFEIFDFDVKSVDEMVSIINKKVLFQRKAIGTLVNQLYLNQSIMASDLPVELKLKLKNNILFTGPLGSGKKTVIEEIENNIGLPYADIIITDDLSKNLKSIMDQLIERSKNDEDASRGIVFIRDNFAELMDIYKQDAFEVPSFFTGHEVIDYGEHKLDFRTLTFVMLFDVRPKAFSDDEISKIQELTDCPFQIKMGELSDRDKFTILLSENGRLTHYANFLEQFGKKLFIDQVSLRRIIRACSSVDPGMNVLHSVIDGIMKATIANSIDDVHINKQCADKYIPVIDSAREKHGDIFGVGNKRKEEVFDESLRNVFELVTQNVIGQDQQVKTILYTILENRRMASKEDIQDPKKYIKNILIRGESGSGKTMIVENIARALNIPTFIADATKYTEEGYVGDSVSDMLVKLYHAAGDNLEAAQRGILFIDELDKKVSNGSNTDVSRGAVLDGMLKIIEGAIIPINVGDKIQEEIIMFDTSRLTVICSGAFEGIEEYRNKRLGISAQLGFGNREEDKTKTKEKDKKIPLGLDKLVDADYCKYGMNKQFMARLPVMIELNKNTEESLINIMKKSNSSALKVEKYILEDRGIELEYTESFYHEIAKEALSLKVGARGISKALERVLYSIHIEDIDSREVAKIVLDGEVVRDPNKVVKIPKEKNMQKVIK